MISSPDSNQRVMQDVVVVTTARDPAGLPVILAFHPNGQGNYQSATMESNFFKSGYGRVGFDAFIKEAINDGRLLSWDKKEASSLVTSPRVQYPSPLTEKADFSKNLTRYENFVKMSRLSDTAPLSAATIALNERLAKENVAAPELVTK